MNGAELASLCHDALAEAGEGEAEIFARVAHRGCARFAIGELGQHMELEEPSAFVRVAKGARVAEASTTRLTREALVDAVREAARAARVVPETEGFLGFLGGDAPSGPAPDRFARATAEATAEARVARLAPAMRRIRDEGLVSAGMLETRRVAMAVVTTRGCRRAFDGTAASFKVWALETPGAGGAAGHGGSFHRDVSALDVEGETERAIRICKMSRDPIALDAGTYDVVMEPEALSELLEWLAMITFGAPEVEQGTSAVAGRAGQRVTGESVTMVEDPLDPSELGFAAPFDREGVWRRRVPLIERGVAREILYDRTYGARAGKPSTGSALPPGAGLGAGVGPSAIGLAPGDAANVDELLRRVDRGLYVCRVHYVNGFLEPRRAVMTGLTRDGCFLVEKGKIVRPVGNMRFTDSFLEALARADGMTQRRTAVPTWWSNAGATVVPAILMRRVCFNGRSQEPPKLT